jgi:hypothetical protein
MHISRAYDESIGHLDKVAPKTGTTLMLRGVEA